MPFLTRLVPPLLVAASAASLVACVIDASPRGRAYGDDARDPGYGSSVGSSGNTQASSTPMLAEVDTGKTMSANPGEGAGVFVEYSAGGHWRIWWTCDTNKTLEVCKYSVKVSATDSGTVKNATFEGARGEGNTFDVSGTTVTAATTTTTAVDAIRFDTEPGAIVRLETTLGGVADSSYIFFVQGGSVNGGFANKLTNPILLQGTTP
ncbi:MAG: hypothetical protein U0169_11450 [Polyangiaceae bacterium]